jgi:hypothetical protein
MGIARVALDDYTFLRFRLSRARRRLSAGREEWIAATLELAATLREARKLQPSNRGFHDWLASNDGAWITHQDRAALLRIAADPIGAQIVMDHHGILAWRAVAAELDRRLTAAGKTTDGDPGKPRQFRPRPTKTRPRPSDALRLRGQRAPSAVEIFDELRDRVAAGSVETHAAVLLVDALGLDADAERTLAFHLATGPEYQTAVVQHIRKQYHHADAWHEIVARVLALLRRVEDSIHEDADGTVVHLPVVT